MNPKRNFLQNLSSLPEKYCINCSFSRERFHDEGTYYCLSPNIKIDEVTGKQIKNVDCTLARVYCRGMWFIPK